MTKFEFEGKMARSFYEMHLEIIKILRDNQIIANKQENDANKLH